MVSFARFVPVLLNPATRTFTEIPEGLGDR